MVNDLLDSYKKSTGGPLHAYLEKFMRTRVCPDCHGARINPRARAVRVGGRSLVEMSSQPIGRLTAFFDALAGVGKN